MQSSVAGGETRLGLYRVGVLYVWPGRRTPASGACMYVSCYKKVEICLCLSFSKRTEPGYSMWKMYQTYFCDW